MQVNGNSAWKARHRHVLAAAVTGLSLAVAMVAPAAAVPAGRGATLHAAPAPRAARGAAIRPSADSAALATAEVTHHAVVVAAATTETSTTVAHPNGNFTMTTYALPVRVRAHHTWRRVSAALHRDPSGSFSPAAVPSGLALSGGGSGPLAVLTSPAGGRMAITFPARLPAPVVTGDTATYQSVFPGVDLHVVATTLGGISTTLTIRNATAARNPKLRTLGLTMATRGLHVSADAAANLSATGPGGRPEFSGSPPLMWDSLARHAGGTRNAGRASGSAAVSVAEMREQSAPISVRLSGGILAMTPAARLLSASAAFPAYISSSITPDTVSQCNTTLENQTMSCQTGFVETQGASACQGYKNWNQPQGDTGYIGNGVGYNAFDSCIGKYQSYYQFGTGNLDPGMHIISAVMTAWDNYGADFGCPTDAIHLDWTKGIGPGTDWSNAPGDDAGDSQRTADVNGGPNPSSTCHKGQMPQWSIQYAMIFAAANSAPTMTFGFTTSNEKSGGDLIRLGDNPQIVITFDRNPKVPTGLTTSPVPHSDPGTSSDDSCPSSASSGYWIGATDLSGGDNDMTLSATIAPNVANESVLARYSVWDVTDGQQPISQLPSLYYGSSGTSPSTTDTQIGFPLTNGHQYEWTAMSEVSGIPTYSDGPYDSANAAACYFSVDTTQPAVPAVTSADFPPSGTTPDVDTAGDSGTFNFTSTDQAPACTGCTASGVYEFEYWLNQPLPVSPPAAAGCPTAQAPGVVLASAPNGSGQSSAVSCAVPVPQWGTNTLYVAAIDAAGNVSQTEHYNFYVRWPTVTDPPAPGDINADGIPDLLGISGSNLVLYPGNSDPAVAPVTAGQPADSPKQDAWNNYQITHRGSMTGGNVDDLFALHQTSAGNAVYLYKNSGGASEQFNTLSNVSAMNGNWSNVTQILAPGDAWLPPSQQTSTAARPSLFAVTSSGQLWLYPGVGSNLGAPVQLGSTGWSGMTLIAPGNVGGSLALWARDNTTGALYSYPISIANGQPTLNPSSPSTPVTATSGAVITGITVPQSAYPAVMSPGPLDNSSYPGLYAETTTGSSPAGSCANGCLYYYPGQSTNGGTAPLSGQPIFVGNLNTPVSQFS